MKRLIDDLTFSTRPLPYIVPFLSCPTYLNKLWNRLCSPFPSRRKLRASFSPHDGAVGHVESVIVMCQVIFTSLTRQHPLGWNSIILWGSPLKSFGGCFLGKCRKWQKARIVFGSDNFWTEAARSMPQSSLSLWLPGNSRQKRYFTPHSISLIQSLEISPQAHFQSPYVSFRPHFPPSTYSSYS